MKIKAKWCFISQKTPICTLHCPVPAVREKARAVTLPWHSTCCAGCWQAFGMPFLGFIYRRPCFLRALGSGSRQVAAVRCGCFLRFRAEQLPGGECSWCGVTQITEKVSFEGWGLTVRGRGAKQSQIHCIKTWSSEPEGKGWWGFALGWEPMSTISITHKMKQCYWRQDAQSWTL